MAVYSAVKRATKGLQRETVAMAVATSVNDMLKEMQPGREAQHLASLLRQVSTRGCDVNFGLPRRGRGDFDGALPVLCLVVAHMAYIDGTRSSTSTCWRCLLSLWRSEEVPVTHCWWVPVSSTSLHDSQVTFHCMTKGQEFVCQVESPGAPHSGGQSGCRHPFHVWTISKWNFADYGSRKFEKQ